MQQSSPAPDSSTPAQRLDIDALRTRLADITLGHPIFYQPAIGSTNTYALELAREDASEGALVTTDDQTSGRGRVGRRWVSLPGQQLTLSLVLRPHFPPHFLVMASALAVAGAIEHAAGIRPEIKWPNDVLIGGRKVCGILIETSGDIAILGMGVNVNGSLAAYPDIAARATTIADAAGHPLSREDFAADLLHRLDADYASLNSGASAARAEVRERWRARLITLGHDATIRQGDRTLTGRALDVDENGALLLREPDGNTTLVNWGDVE